MTEMIEAVTSENPGESRIVVGVDGSEGAQRALEFAAHEAARWGALLQVLCTYEIPAMTTWVVVPMESFEEAATSIVSDALDRVHALEPAVVTKGEVMLGEPGASLIRASRDASLLVVGCRGRGELACLVLGSVSEHVVHRARCAVTVVR